MPIGVHDEKYVDQFFRQAPRCLFEDRNDATVSYLATQQPGGFVVIAARMTLGDQVSTATLPSALLTNNVRAGYFRLSEVGRSPSAFVRALLNDGVLKTPEGDLQFPGNGSGMHSAWLSALDDAGLHGMRRVAVLQVHGAPQSGMVGRTEFDWELKAAEIPFGGVDDLAAEFRFGQLDGQSIKFEVVAENVVEVADASNVRGTTATLWLRARVQLDRSDVSLRLRVLSRGTVVRRSSFTSDQLTWDTADGHDRAVLRLEVPKGSTLHCAAVFGDLAQHERVIVDQAAHENPLRVAFESFDAGLAGLRSLLESGGGRRNDARTAESALAWTLTILGFKVFHLGGVEQTQDAVDIVAASPAGDLLLVECTTGVLKGDKVANLLSRAARVRASLFSAGFAHIRVVPIMATTKSEDEVAANIESTEKLGVVVICREQMDEWLQLSAVMPDADGIAARAAQRLENLRSTNAGPDLAA